MPELAHLNDQSSYQRCFACGQRNLAGLQMVFRQQGNRISADFLPQERHQGFPGLVHGGIMASLLDETLGRTGALRREWLMTGTLDIRFRRPAAIGQPLRAWGEILRERRGAIEARGALEQPDGVVVAQAHGLFLRLPPPVAAQALARYPDLAAYLEA